MPKLTPETIAELRLIYEEAMRVGSNEMAWDEWTTAISEAAEDLFDAAAERDALAVDADKWQRAALTLQGDRDALLDRLAHMTESRDNARVWDEGSDFVTRHPGMSAEYVRAANPYRQTEWNQHDRLDMPTNA